MFLVFSDRSGHNLIFNIIINRPSTIRPVCTWLSRREEEEGYKCWYAYLFFFYFSKARELPCPDTREAYQLLHAIFSASPCLAITPRIIVLKECREREMKEI